jgi:signal transduction histidine kinase
MIRLAPSGVVASPAATRAGGQAGGQALSRFAAPEHRLRFWLALWAAAIAAEFAVLAPVVFGDEPAPGFRIVFRLIGGTFAACGLIAWHRRPDSRSGPLMIATGFGLFIEPLFGQFDSPTLQTVGEMFEDVWGIFIIALLLTILTAGRLQSTVDRVLVGAFVLQLYIELARHLFLEQDGNFLLVHADARVADTINTANLWLTSVSCLAVAVAIGTRWKVASPPRRRALLPSVAGISCLLLFAVVQQSQPRAMQWLAVCSLLSVPLAFLVGLLRSRLARGGLAELFRDLNTMPGAALQAALAKTLGDPALVVAYRLPGSLGYADSDGRAVLVPPVAHDRASAPIGRGGREVAALVSDASLDDDPELVEAVCAAAGIALENEHLHEESRARLTEIQASRERIVAAGDAERRRLERDLHDGAQQRLVAIALQLSLVKGRIQSDPATAEQLVVAAGDELALSLAELRELARGIHPAVLNHGLAAALDSLAARSTVATTVSYEATGPLPEPVQLAAYFVASEALANVAKYAHATSVTMRVWRTGQVATIEIADDGVGGADGADGSGLRGLADRVEALQGSLRVCSPAGAGTTVTAELPCGLDSALGGQAAAEPLPRPAVSPTRRSG